MLDLSLFYINIYFITKRSAIKDFKKKENKKASKEKCINVLELKEKKTIDGLYCALVTLPYFILKNLNTT